MSEETRRALREMGLTEYESRVYLALLGGGMMTANQVSEAAGVAYSKIYETLNQLERKGWVETSSGRPSRYCPKSPSEAFEAAKLRLEDRLEVWRQTVEAELQPLYEKRELREKPDLWILRGEFHVAAKLREMLGKARLEVMVATPFQVGGFVEALAPVLGGLKASRVRVHVLVTENVWAGELQALAGFAEMRVRDSMFGGGVIVDSREAMLFLGEDKPSLVIWSSHAGLVRFAKEYFQHLWNTAKTKH